MARAVARRHRGLARVGRIARGVSDRRAQGPSPAFGLEAGHLPSGASSGDGPAALGDARLEAGPASRLTGWRGQCRYGGTPWPPGSGGVTRTFLHVIALVVGAADD